MRHLAHMGKNVTLVQLQKSIKSGDPVGHVHGGCGGVPNVRRRVILLDKVVQREQLFFAEVVLPKNINRRLV